MKDAEPHARDEIGTVVARIGAVIRTIDLDCSCRERVAEALARFAELEVRRSARRELSEARHQRERIAGILDFLAELDEIASDEVDTGVYRELAHLFDDVAAAAHAGAEAMRRLAGETER